LALKALLFEKRVGFKGSFIKVFLVLPGVFILVDLHDRLDVSLNLSLIELVLLLDLFDPCSDGGLGLRLVHGGLLDSHLSCGLAFSIRDNGQIHHPQDPFLNVQRRDVIHKAYLPLPTLHDWLGGRPAQRRFDRCTLPLHFDDHRPGLRDGNAEGGGPAILDRKLLGPGR
jgi:hypothetical protein